MSWLWHSPKILKLTYFLLLVQPLTIPAFSSGLLDAKFLQFFLSLCFLGCQGGSSSLTIMLWLPFILTLPFTYLAKLKTQMTVSLHPPCYTYVDWHCWKTRWRIQTGATTDVRQGLHCQPPVFFLGLLPPLIMTNDILTLIPSFFLQSQEMNGFPPCHQV